MVPGRKIKEHSYGGRKLWGIKGMSMNRDQSFELRRKKVQSSRSFTPTSFPSHLSCLVHHFIAVATNREKKVSFFLFWCESSQNNLFNLLFHTSRFPSFLPLYLFCFKRKQNRSSFYKSSLLFPLEFWKKPLHIQLQSTIPVSLKHNEDINFLPNLVHSFLGYCSWIQNWRQSIFSWPVGLFRVQWGWKRTLVSSTTWSSINSYGNKTKESRIHGMGSWWLSHVQCYRIVHHVRWTVTEYGIQCWTVFFLPCC